MMVFISLILPLALLVACAWRGASVLLLAPIMALLAVLLAGQPLLASITQIFMPALAGFVEAFFLLFLLGAIFGKLMEASGAAGQLALAITKRMGPQRGIAAVVLACALLTYGGVSLFVVAFAVYPLAIALFKRAGTPETLIPAAIALGAFTFTMTALPGTPAIQNAIPMPYFGTDLFAAPGLGLIAACIMGFGGLAYLNRKAAASGGSPATSVLPGLEPSALPLWCAALPIGIVLVGNFVLSRMVFPGMDLAYLSAPEWGGASASSITGIWSIITAMCVAICVLLVLTRRQISHPIETVGTGAATSLMPLFNTASLVGFGAVIASLPAFEALRSLIDSVPGGAAEALAISTGLLAGITGSASGGMSIALDLLGQEFLERSAQEAATPDLLHRVTALATGGLDALPHNGAVITLLSIGGLTHRQAYWPIFIVAVIVPLVALGAVLMLAHVFGTF